MDTGRAPRARSLRAADAAWLQAEMRARWGGLTVVRRGRVHTVTDLDGLVVHDGGEYLGLLLYRNLDALRFYQRRGFTIAAVHCNAVEEARTLKPSIPRVGEYGIPIRDEIELERML